MDAVTKTAAQVGQFDRQGTLVEHGRSVGSTRSKYSVGAWFGAALESGLANRFLTDNAGMKCWARHQGLLHWHDVDQQALQQHTRIVELCG